MTDAASSTPEAPAALVRGVPATAGSVRVLPALLACALVTGAAFANGGYFPGSWGWLTLGCAWAAGLALVLSQSTAITALGVAWVGAWTALTAWTALSGVWSVDPTQTVLEGERTLVYVAAALAALAVGGRSRTGILRGAWAAIALVSTYSLLTRLLPERLGVYDPIAGNRLDAPIGYWNSLGLFAAMGLLLAVGIVARGDRRVVRVVAAASTVPMTATLYFTFGRGPWLALAIGALAMLAVERSRLRLLATLALLAPWPAIAIGVASRSHPLTSSGATLASMAHDGHRVLAVAALMAAAAAAAAAALIVLEGRVSLAPWAHRATDAGLVAVVAAVLLSVFALYGSPVTLVQRGWHDFATAPTSSGGGSTDLNSRLFHLYGTGRVTQWRVAWAEATQHPVLGSGAGTYQHFWDLHRPVSGKVRNVHNLYLSTLAELGPIGLALLVAVLALPLAALRRARGAPLAAAAAGAYVAYLAHAAADWDWEITSVTLVALLCGAALVAAARRDARPPARAGRRALAIGAAALLAAGGVYTLAEQISLTRAADAAARGDWPAAAGSTRRAADIAPWSTAPWQQLGEAQLAARRFADARRSFVHALSLDSGDWALWLDLARASDGRQRAHALDRALALNPRSPEALGFRAQLQSLSQIGTGP